MNISEIWWNNWNTGNVYIYISNHMNIWNMLEKLGICGNMWDYVGICGNKLEYVRKCNNILVHVRFVWNVRKYVGICWNMQGYTEYDGICKNIMNMSMLKYSGIPSNTFGDLGLCENVWECMGICRTIQDSVWTSRNRWRYVGVCWNMQEYVSIHGIFANMLECTIICGNI